ncbi:MAG: c-type cytochrome [Xanthobacteraceae bacterium]
MWTRLLLALVVVLLLAGTGFVMWAWEPAIALTTPPDASSFGPELKERGAELARIGNCNVCHAGRNKAFAGGRALPTPFGTIYATNITPDPETGIGRWSEAAFARAMREGVDQQGRHLYPAFPYDHFTKLTDDDVKALYAFLMTREGVRAETPANELPFPLNIRLTVAGWKLLFFRQGRFNPDAARDEAWNRGAYLAEAVGHCGACHTPRNSLGAEEKHRAFAGGSSEGWHAPALNAQSPAPVPWSADSLFVYLRSGFEPLHAAAAGPMMPVVRNLEQVPEEDVRAIALYVASTIGPPTPERQHKADELIAKLNRSSRETVGLGSAGGEGRSAVFAGACAPCHSETRTRGAAGTINLALSTAVNLPDPRNAIRIVLDGSDPGAGRRGPSMPGFADVLTDAQVVELLKYARARFTTLPAWSDLEARVRRIREGKDQS